MEVDCMCPYCGEPIGLWLDEGGGGSQRYVEDCSVCCRPIEVAVTPADDGELTASVSRQGD
jgi:hypothetical protein